MRLSHPTQLAPTNPVSEEITMNATIRCLIRELDCLPNSAGLDELFRVVKGHAIRLDDVREFVRFFETRTDRYPAGSVLGGEDAAMHTVDNLSSAREGLVTMHVYRPALTRMELFDVEDGRLVVREAAVLRLSSSWRLNVAWLSRAELGQPLCVPSNARLWRAKLRTVSGVTRMNTNTKKPAALRCPRCRAEAEVVVLGRNGRSIVVECHCCLTLQVVVLTATSSHAVAKRSLGSETL